MELKWVDGEFRIGLTEGLLIWLEDQSGRRILCQATTVFLQDFKAPGFEQVEDGYREIKRRALEFIPYIVAAANHRFHEAGPDADGRLRL